jgi:hypothetical protein
MLQCTRSDLEEGIDWRQKTPLEWKFADDIAKEKLGEIGVCQPYEKEYIRKDGTRIQVLVGVTLVENGEVIAFALDISARKRAEQLAVDAAKAKSFFIANISHGKDEEVYFRIVIVY